MLRVCKQTTTTTKLSGSERRLPFYTGKRATFAASSDDANSTSGTEVTIGLDSTADEATSALHAKRRVVLVAVQTATSFVSYERRMFPLPERSDARLPQSDVGAAGRRTETLFAGGFFFASQLAAELRCTAISTQRRTEDMLSVLRGRTLE
jgi:hypothetical protein